MHQPLGFRTTYQPTDYDEENDAAPGAGMPALSVSGAPDHRTPVEGSLVSSFGQAQVVQINDNGGRLFPVGTFGGTTVVTDESLFPDLKMWPPKSVTTQREIAIGEIRTTDVLVVELDNESAPGGFVPYRTDWLPAGRAAYWSLAEVLRRAAKRQLDIDPQELVVGLHPTPQGASSVFIADALDNGAGYAEELGRPENFRSLLVEARKHLTEDWNESSHANCASSCLDCLRSYDNRRLHGALDWRLALDMLDLAAGEPLNTRRWLDLGHQVAQGLASTASLSLSAHETSDGLPYIANASSGKAVLLGHPLWRRDLAYAVEDQIEAFDEVNDTAGTNGTSVGDAFEAVRRPLAVVRSLI